MSQLTSIQRMLRVRAKSRVPTFFLQIGANDGITGDPIHPFLMENDWGALVVEPIQDYFKLLCDRYRNRPLVKPVRAAVTDFNGQVVLCRLDPSAIEAGKVPRWGHGASSLYLNRTALGWDLYRPHLMEERVPATTLQSLLEEHAIESVDVLQIDAEGHDYHILKQFDFARFRPSIINIELVNLPENEGVACKEILSRNGYVFRKTGYDLVAVPFSG